MGNFEKILSSSQLFSIVQQSNDYILLINKYHQFYQYN
jgi:hypothetical protein